MSENTATKRTDLMLVSPSNIVIEADFNVRKDYGDLQGLMQSIIENGQIEPISGTKVRGEDKYILTDGHRRMKAIQMAIEKGYEIPFVKLVTSTSNMEDRLIAMVVTGIGKKALNVLEEGEAYKRLVAYGFTPKELSKKVGKSNAHVYNLLTLSNAPKVVKNAIEREDISSTMVIQLIREIKNADELIGVIETAIGEAKKGGETKRVSVKNITKLKSPIQKLREASEIVGEDKKEFVASLLVELTRKDSTPQSIAKLFE